MDQPARRQHRYRVSRLTPTGLIHLDKFRSANTSHLHTAYTTWAPKDGAEPMSQKAFGQALDRKGYPVTRTRTGSVRNGLGVKREGTDRDW